MTTIRDTEVEVVPGRGAGQRPIPITNATFRGCYSQVASPTTTIARVAGVGRVGVDIVAGQTDRLVIADRTADALPKPARAGARPIAKVTARVSRSESTKVTPALRISRLRNTSETRGSS